MIDRIRGRRLQEIRAEYRRIAPLCERCSERNPPRVRLWTQLDHRVALVNGGVDFDVDPEQRQGLCDECHAEKTDEDLKRGPSAACDEQGWPTDPRHPWNRPR